MKQKIFDIIKYFIITFLIIASIYLLYRIYKLNILVAKYYLIVLLLILLLNILIIFKLIRKKTRKFSKIIFMILSLIISFIYLYGATYINKTINFVSNMTEEKYETRNYKIYALENKKIENINKIGYLNIYEDSKYIKEQLKDKKLKSYEDIGTLLGAIYNDEIEAVILDNSYIELLKENDVDFIKEAIQIYEFEVRKINEVTTKQVDIRKDPFMFFISGSDSRGSINLVARSDVNIAVVVNPKTNKILLISIPRDYYVQLHGTTGSKDKLTHAGIYGVEKSMKTVGDLLGQDINYYLKVGFQTVVNVVDVVDGIDIYSDQDIKEFPECKIKKGMNHFDGECALAFSRERHEYATGDRHRGENQQQVITKLVEKLNNPKYLTRYNQILKAMDGSFKTNMTYEEITNFIKYQLNNLKKWNVESISLDGSDAHMPTYSMGRQLLYVMMPNQKTVTEAKEKIKLYMGGQ